MVKAYGNEYAHSEDGIGEIKLAKTKIHDDIKSIYKLLDITRLGNHFKPVTTLVKHVNKSGRGIWIFL